MHVLVIGNAFMIIINIIAAVKLYFIILKLLSFVLEKEHWIKAMNMLNTANIKWHIFKEVCSTCNPFSYVCMNYFHPFVRVSVCLPYSIWIIIERGLYGCALHKLRSTLWLAGKKMVQSEIKRKIDCTRLSVVCNAYSKNTHTHNLSENYHTTHIHTHTK